MVQVVCEIDVLASRNAHADESTRTCGVYQRLRLVGGTNERGIATILLDGLAIRRTELHVARRQQIFQYDLLSISGLVKLVDIDERKRGQRDVQVKLVLEVQFVIIVVAQFWRQQNLAETRLSTTLPTYQQRC